VAVRGQLVDDQPAAELRQRPVPPQLIAVTDNANQSKGDHDPSTWQPPRTSYRCTYAKMWIRAKYHWELRLQSSEKSALQSMLNICTS